MKRKERHLTVTGWVVVGLLDTLAGVISGGLMALWQGGGSCPVHIAGAATGQSAGSGFSLLVQSLLHPA